MPHLLSRGRLALLALVTFSSGGVSACTLEPESSSTSALRLEFPAHTAEVLGAPLVFAATDRGFARTATAADGARVLHAELPRLGEDALLIEGREGFSIHVREVGAFGEGSPVGNAVAYRRAGGTSYWTASVAGVEEWLHLDAGLATAGRVVAAWDVDGAAAAQEGSAIALRDTAGVTRILVTAPVAYAASGREVDARLSVRGARIELTVDAGGEAVLVDPLWATASSLTEKRINHTLTALGSGKVIITGGNNYAAVGASDLAIASTEIRDPATGAWTSTAPMTSPRLGHTATLLGNGQLLVVAGTVSGNEAGALASAELYDPATDTWTAASPLAVARYGHAAVAVGPGNTRVLIVGGIDGSANMLTSAELYDSATNTWSAVPSMATARASFTLTPLDSGKILVAGGKAKTLSSLAEAELYDPTTSTWTATAPLHTSRFRHSATLLEDGKVLVAAGSNASDPFYSGILKTTEIYDPLSGTWSAAAPLSAEHDKHTATRLENGGVLLTGGDVLGKTTGELYDPSADAWIAAGNLAIHRDYATALLLESGSVLIAGGVSAADGRICELYASSAAGAPCTSAVECQSGSCVSGACAAVPTSSSSSSGAGGSGSSSGGAGGAASTSVGASSSAAGAGGGAPAQGGKANLSACSVDGVAGRSSSSVAPWVALGLLCALRRRKPAAA